MFFSSRLSLCLSISAPLSLQQPVNFTESFVYNNIFELKQLILNYFADMIFKMDHLTIDKHSFQCFYQNRNIKVPTLTLTSSKLFKVFEGLVWWNSRTAQFRIRAFISYSYSCQDKTCWLKSVICKTAAVSSKVSITGFASGCEELILRSDQRHTDEVRWYTVTSKRGELLQKVFYKALLRSNRV